MSDICQECGMPVFGPQEYHPYAACLMFKACHDSIVVRENLHEVYYKGMEDANNSQGRDVNS